MFKLKSSKGTRIDTLIGAKTRIDGNVEFAGGARISGRLIHLGSQGPGKGDSAPLK